MKKPDATPQGGAQGGLDFAIVFWTLLGAVMFAITLLR